VGALALAVGVTGLLEAVEFAELPWALEPLRDRLPVIFPLHMGAAALALLGITVTLVTRRRPDIHRVVGRLSLACILVGGAAALPTALLSGAGTIARAGFFAQGIVWLVLAAIGYRAIRAGSVALHRAAMLLMASVAFGAIVLRLMLAAASPLALDVLAWYGTIAWLAWLLPVGVVSAALAVGKRRATSHKEVMALRA